jgi:hypothetical protein
MGERASLEFAGSIPAPPLAQRIREMWEEVTKPRPKRNNDKI